MIKPYEMKHTLLLTLFITICSFLYGQQEKIVSMDLDSLLKVSESQSGLEKSITYRKISEKHSLQHIDKARQYALDGLYEIEQILNDVGAGADKDDLLCEHARLCRQAAQTYYLEASKSANKELHMQNAAKIRLLAEQVDKSYSLIKDKKKYIEADPNIAVIVPQSFVIYYICKEDYDSALYSLDKCIELGKGIESSYLAGQLLQNKAILLYNLGKVDEAISTLSELEEVVSKDETPSAKVLLTVCYENKAAFYVNTKQYSKGEEYIRKALHLAEPDSNYTIICYCYGGLAEIAEAKGDYKSAFEYNKVFYAYQDTLYNKNKSEQITAMEVKLDTAQKEMVIEKLEHQKYLTGILIAVLIVIIALVGIYANYRRRANTALKEKNKKIEEQRDEIAQQRDELNTMLVELSDNISYASLLQNRIMLGDRKIDEVINKAFVIYSPKDVVGGDFFYVKQCGDYKIIAVADCTGHGMSAALLTVMNISFLNEYFVGAPKDSGAEFNPYFDPAVILERLRNNVKTTLNAQENETIAMSGMDMALLVHKKGDTRIKFAGANRPLYIVRENKELVEIRPVRNPVASYVREQSFETNDFEYKESDMFYMFSDGITDQFSADGSSKLKTKGLKDMLVKYAGVDEVEQKKRIMADFNKFRGTAEQLDDTIIVGVRGSSL